MKLVTLNDHHLGVKVEEGIIDFMDVSTRFPDEDVPTDVMEVIEGGEKKLQAVKEVVDKLKKEGTSYVNEVTIRWGPAVTRPRKIICVGLNYKKHADETGASYPEIPIIFNKFDNALT